MHPQFTLSPHDIARFWSRVNKSGPIIRPELGPCWEWIGARTKRGYGQFEIGPAPRRTYYAHRISYLIAHGELDPDLHVCHECDNPPCMRPTHLFQGTAMDNVRDAVRKGHMGTNAKIPEAVVREIRRLRPDGKHQRLSANSPASIRSLAERFGLSAGHVSMIAHGLTRASVASNVQLRLFMDERQTGDHGIFG